MTTKRFTAILHDSGRGGGRWLEVPFDPRDAFGAARAPVRGTANGAPLRSRLMIYGGKPYLGLTREVREAAGVEVGDPVDVVLELDDLPRDVDVPPALAAALAGDEVAGRAFEALGYTHRHEYASWVADAKREDTRLGRVEKALVMLRAAAQHPSARGPT